MNNDLVLLNLVTPLIDKVDFANAPTDGELLLAATEEATDSNAIPDPIPDILANTDHVPNVNHHILTTAPQYTTPIPYPVNVLTGYVERIESPIPNDITCLPITSITPEIRECIFDAASETANVTAFWLYHVTI